MKQIKNVITAINNEEFYREQFEDFASDKNILFMSPQLSGKQLYKIFLPFCGMYNTNNLTAITSVEKYNPREQLTNINLPIKSNYEILWADYVVVPFTAQSLTNGEHDLYDSIRAINSNCKIVFCIDFNFYELSDLHPYKDIFTREAILKVEDNMWNSDICLVSNMAFRKYLLDKMIKLGENRMSGIHTDAGITCMPFFLDSQILLDNVDYDPQQPEKVTNEDAKKEPSAKKQLNKINEIANPITESKKQIKVLKEGASWSVKKDNYKKPLMSFKKKEEAINYAKTNIEEGYDIIIFKKDGTVQQSIIAKHQKNKKD